MRAMAALLLALLPAACAALGRGEHTIEVSAAPGPDGIRVRFRRTSGADPDRPPELSADGGSLEEVTVSPDLRAISVLWRAPAGSLRCRFPFGGDATFGAAGPVDPHAVPYVLLDDAGVRVTADLPRGCLLLPELPLHLRLREGLEPARMVLPDGRALAREGDRFLLPLTRDERGVLRRGDLPVTVETAEGRVGFLVGIDDDGTPAAVSGYVGASREDTGAAAGD